MSRVLKRRTLAKDLADAGRVQVNGRPAKPSTEVRVGDVLTLTLGGRRLTVEVRELRSTASVVAARGMVRLLADERRTEEEFGE